MIIYTLFIKLTKSKIKFIAFLLLILITIKRNSIENVLKLEKSKVKSICFCSPAKKENRYINEFVKYYLNFGVDKIFIYDNNNIEGEIIDDILVKYIKKALLKLLILG
jgi:hypothetical protein